MLSKLLQLLTIIIYIYALYIIFNIEREYGTLQYNDWHFYFNKIIQIFTTIAIYHMIISLYY